MIKFLFTGTNGLVNYIVTPETSNAYINGNTYGSDIARSVDTVVADSVILTTWHWTGTVFATHAVEPDGFYLWNIPTFSYTLRTPTPTITGLTIATGFKYIDLSWIITESTWLGVEPFETEIWSGTSPTFSTATATKLATVSNLSYRHEDTPVTARYYWLRATWSSGTGTGATVQTTSIIPSAIATADIALNSVMMIDSVVTYPQIYAPLPTGTALADGGNTQTLAFLALTPSDIATKRILNYSVLCEKLSLSTGYAFLDLFASINGAAYAFQHERLVDINKKGGENFSWTWAVDIPANTNVTFALQLHVRNPVTGGTNWEAIIVGEPYWGTLTNLYINSASIVSIAGKR